MSAMPGAFILWNFFTQRRKGRKGESSVSVAPASLTRLCAFAAFASLRERISVSAAGEGEFLRVLELQSSFDLFAVEPRK
jgi:hypothetical protein